MIASYSRRLVVAVLLIGLIATAIAAYTVLKIIRVEVEVKVPPETITVELVVDSPEGSRVFEDVAVLELDRVSKIRFKLLRADSEGRFKISISGKAILSSAGGEEVVTMPCLYTLNTTCYRVQVVIPGYDAPLELPPGRYTVDLELSWKGASGEGRVILEIGIVEES